MEILTPSGTILKLNKDNDVELFQAAKVSLGYFGAILNVTIKVEKAFNIKEKKYVMTFDQVKIYYLNK